MPGRGALHFNPSICPPPSIPFDARHAPSLIQSHLFPSLSVDRFTRRRRAWRQWPGRGAWGRPACRSAGISVSANVLSFVGRFYRLLTSHLAKRSSISPRRSAAILLSSFRLRRTTREATAR